MSFMLLSVQFRFEMNATRPCVNRRWRRASQNQHPITLKRRIVFKTFAKCFSRSRFLERLFNRLLTHEAVCRLASLCAKMCVKSVWTLLRCISQIKPSMIEVFLSRHIKLSILNSMQSAVIFVWSGSARKSMTSDSINTNGFRSQRAVLLSDQHFK